MCLLCSWKMVNNCTRLLISRQRRKGGQTGKERRWLISRKMVFAACSWKKEELSYRLERRRRRLQVSRLLSAGQMLLGHGICFFLEHRRYRRCSSSLTTYPASYYYSAIGWRWKQPAKAPVLVSVLAKSHI